MYFHRECFFEGGVCFKEGLIKNKEKKETYKWSKTKTSKLCICKGVLILATEKNRNNLECLDEGVLAVLSSLFLAAEKKKKEIVLLTLKIEDKEVRLMPLFI